jgi:uncharacterized protein
MRWRGQRESSNVEDRRGMRLPGGGIALGGGGVLVSIVALLLGADPRPLLQQVEQLGREDREPKLVLFTHRVESACGLASAAVGPFYCPADEKLYIDLRFYELLRSRFHAPGDFAQAYVVAHEVGHHVQNLLGISAQVGAMPRQLSEADYNQLSVRMELQADFLAGMWAHHTESMKQLLEAGDIEEALRAASAIGDDAIQRQTQGEVVPDAFTHGTSEQRMRWFMKGYRTGDMSQGDTFKAREL